jgi:hypothetical protein
MTLEVWFNVMRILVVVLCGLKGIELLLRSIEQHYDVRIAKARLDKFKQDHFK